MTGVWLSPYPLDLGGDDSSVTMTPHCLRLTRCLRADACVHSMDWYMVSQKGLKGTSRPTHYHILQADFGTPAELQQLTFDLCHLYARATKVVSRPAPVYYAHRAAFLAQYYKDGYREENMFEVGSTTSHGSRGSGGSVQSIVLGINICNTVYFA